MTDFLQLIGLFDCFHIDYAVNNRSLDHAGLDQRIAKVVKIKEGVGYPDFYTEFYFDADGKFICHGLWE